MLKVHDKNQTNLLDAKMLGEHLKWLQGEECPLKGAYFRDNTYLPRVTLTIIATGKIATVLQNS